MLFRSVCVGRSWSLSDSTICFPVTIAGFLVVRLRMRCRLLLLGTQFLGLHHLRMLVFRIFPYSCLQCILFLANHDTLPPETAILLRKLYTFCDRFKASIDSVPSDTSTALASLIPFTPSIHSVFTQFWNTSLS